MSFEPKIVGILCNWCSYTGADLAGTSRIKYAPNVRVVKVMCSGRVDATFILKALDEGADGVLIAGCHPGDCHYKEGNYKTMRRYPLLKKMLAQFGIEDGRVRLEWVSASEGDKFAAVVNEMTEQVRKLGPFKRPIDSVPADEDGEREEHKKTGSTKDEEQIETGGAVVRELRRM